MGKMFKSLMLDTRNQLVDSAAELKKAVLLGEHLQVLLAGIPSFREMTRVFLAERLRQLDPGVELSSVFINRGSVGVNLELRPQGSLLDVCLECLARNISPNYVYGSDDIYDRASTTDVRYKLKTLSIQQVESLIHSARINLSAHHCRNLDVYWQSPLSGQSGTTQKIALQQALSRTLMAELSLSVIAGRLEDYQGETFANMLASGSARALYRVKIESSFNKPVPFSWAIVAEYANRGLPTLVPGKESYGYMLYSPQHGFEYFDSSARMHEQISKRLSIPGGEITYPGLTSGAFEYCAGAQIDYQKDEVRRAVESREQDPSRSFTALQNTQHMSSLREQWQAAIESLRRGIQRTEWPTWLQAAGKDVQARYEELEVSMVKYHEEFQRNHAPYFSLQAYARNAAENWIRSFSNAAVNADTIRVRSTYEMKLGGKTVRQEDNRSLTEVVALGAHDPGFTSRLVLEGAQGTGLTGEKLGQWLQTFDARVQYSETRSRSPSPAYREALSNKLISKLNFDLWVARHSRFLDQAEFDRVNRAMAGDTSVLMVSVGFERGSPLKDVLVFQAERRDEGPQLVYMRTVEGPHGFLRFNHFQEFVSKLKVWMSSNADYAASLLNAVDLPLVGKALEKARGLQWDLNQIRAYSSVMPRMANDPLAGPVILDYGWSYSAAQSLAPQNYRSISLAERQQQGRHHTELRALHNVALRETGLPSYESFARKLIKERIEQVLRSRNSFVEVDPDLIYVQISPTEDWVLSELIVQERAFEPPSSPQWDPRRDYPRFHWAGTHPSLDALSIKDIASWSKTLRPGERYIDMLKAEFRPGAPSYSFKREVYTRRQQCEISMALTSQYADEGLSREQFKGLQRVVGSLLTPLPIGPANPVVKSDSVYPLWIKNTRRVDGVLLFRVATASGLEDFLYTPNAPDQIAFRSTADFVWSIRNRSGSMGNYYLDRVALADRKVVSTYFDELIATVSDQPAPAPFGDTRIRDLRTTYDSHISRLIEDVDHRTTSLAEIIGRLVYDNVKLAMSVVALAVPPVGLLVTVVGVVESAYKGASAYYYAENEEALGHLKDALLGLISLGQASTASQQAAQLKRTFFELIGDADTVMGLLASSLGQTLGHERLKEIIQQELEAIGEPVSKTTVY